MGKSEQATRPTKNNTQNPPPFPKQLSRLLSLRGVSPGSTELQQHDCSLASSLFFFKLVHKAMGSSCHFHTYPPFILSIFIPSPIALSHATQPLLATACFTPHSPLPLWCMHFPCIPLLSSFPFLLPPLMLVPPTLPYTSTLI